VLPALVVDRLRGALSAVGYTYDGVTATLGPEAHAALGRNETTPGLRATTGASPLETLTRLWPLQAPVDRAEAEHALPGLVEELCAGGLLERSADSVRARLDLRPYADTGHDWWVVSDLTPGLDGRPARVRPDHVLGVSAASTTLAQLTVRERARRALDVGCGCGVQSLHMAAHTELVVATDVNERALELARLTAALNQVRLDIREGSLFEPVGEETFDLVASNPPFVTGPGTGELLAYRDSGLPGDQVVRRLVVQAPAHLSEGGWCHLLANWLHVEGQDWADRVASWLAEVAPADTRCDAWVVQREVADPASYVELWLKDAGHHGAPDYRDRYDAWLGWLEAQRVTGIGFGWISLHRTGGEPVVRIEDWPYDVEQPLGPEVAAWARRSRRARDEDLLGRRLVRRADVRQESVGEPGAEDPQAIVLRQQRGMRRARRADTVEAALVGACDGDLTSAQVLDALATLLDADPAALRKERLPALRELVAEGFLEVLG
jgi:SAM-dependent methyltransferase